MCAGAWRRIVLIVGVLVAPPPARAIAASPGQTSEAAFQDEISAGRELLLTGRYAAAESLLTPWLMDSSKGGESTGALEIADLWVEARVKGGKASQPATLALAEHVVEARERLADQFGLSRSLHNLGLAFEERGESSRATETHQRAVAIVRSASSSERDPSLADGLEQLARAFIGQERFADAKRALEEARSLQLTLHAPDSADSGQILFLEALLHRADGDYERAAALLDKAGPVLTSARPQHPDTAAVLQLEGDLLFLRGRGLESTRAKWTEALDLSEKTLGPEHPHVAMILRRLAAASKYSGDLAQARAFQERAMGIVERAGAPCQKEFPELLNDFAGLLKWAADYQEARRRYQQALDRSIACLGREHSMTATVLYNQADLAIEMGDFILGERLLRTAIADWSKRLGSTHPYVARGLDSLAEVVALEGRDGDVRRLVERALVLRRQALGPDHPDVAVTLVTLATVLEKNGSVALASQCLGQALEIYRRGKVPQDPDYLATALQVRARLSARRGDLAAAREDYGEVAAIRTRLLGAEHPLTAAARGDVAAADFVLGSDQSALDGALVAETEGRNQLQMTARFLPGRQALLYADKRPRGLSLAISILSSQHINDVSRVFDAVVRSRGLVLDELAERSQWTVAAAPGRAALRAAVASRQARYATLMLRSVQGEVVPRALLDEAQQQAEEAERELAEHSGVDRNDRERSQPGLNEVRQALPAGTALVSFVRYDRTRLTTISGRTMTRVRPWYIALVITSNTAMPVAVSIGTAVAVESAIEAWRNEFRDAAIVAVRAEPDEALRSYRAAGERLRRLVWDPLGPTSVWRVQGLHRSRRRAESCKFSGPTNRRHALPCRNGSRSASALEQNAIFSRIPRCRLVAACWLSADRATMQLLHQPWRPQGEMTEVAAMVSLCTLRIWRQLEPRSPTSPICGRRDRVRVPFWDAMTCWVPARGAASKPAVMQAASGRLVLHFATHGFFLGSECQPVAGTRSVGGLASATAPPLARAAAPRIRF